MRSVLCGALICWMGVVAMAQTSSPPAHTPAPWKKYCQSDDGFCFKYPPSWRLTGDIYGGNGVVVAPVQKDGQPLLNEVTVAMIAPPKDSDGAVGLDTIIQQATTGIRESGQDFQTLRRQVRTVDAKPAELLKVQYHEKSTGKDWIEELIFIQGPDNEIYSVALKCVSSDILHLEPVFSEIVRTWMLPEPAVPQDAESENTPASTAPPAQPPSQPTSRP
jgi:hypothetical protein